MDTYRVNRYNITTPGVTSNRLIQGAFRYQKLNLTSNGVLTLKNVGVRPTIDNTPISQLPGAFHSSDDVLNRIWETGARTVQMTEIPKDSVPDFVQVTPEGTLVDSLSPQALSSTEASQLVIYDMGFDVNPIVGGFGFSVLSDTLNSAIYISCNIESRKIGAYAGSTTEDDLLQSSELPTNLSLAPGRWYSVHTEVNTSNITVSIDGVEVLKLSQDSRLFGSFGFGASFGHRAIFRDLSVTDAEGQDLYTHSLRDPSFLPDFFMGSNPLDTVVDGSRRDRIAYTGDLDIAGGAALVSTHGLKYILGSLDILGSYQMNPGFFVPTAKIQQNPLKEIVDANITGLIGYSFNFLTAVSTTYMHTGDAEFARQWAPTVQAMLDWAHSQTLDNGLFNISDASFGGDWNYYDPPQTGAVTKFNALYAYALQESGQLLADGGADSEIYRERLDRLRQAIDDNLWDDKLQAYSLSGDIDGFSQDANAIAILAGVNVNPSHSTQAILDSMKTLMTPSGPLAFSSEVISAGFQPYISPYASSYHLRAALASNDSETALDLLDSLWGPMADEENANYTGTFWETLDQDGRPGLGLTTSLCHGWAAGPTAELSRYVLGAQPTQPGWAEFKVAPLTMGLKLAKGSVPTLSGEVDIEWSFDSDDLLTMVIEAPAGTVGRVSLPNPLLVSAKDSMFVVNGQEVNDTSFEVQGGQEFVLTQNLKEPKA